MSGSPKNCPLVKKPSQRRERGYQLWHFLLEVLFDARFEPYIRWTGNGLEFQIIDRVVTCSAFRQRKEDPTKEWDINITISQKEVNNIFKGLRDCYYRYRVEQNLKTDQIRDKPYITKISGFTGIYRFEDESGFICQRLNRSMEEIMEYIRDVAERNPERRSSREDYPTYPTPYSDQINWDPNTNDPNPHYPSQPYWEQIPGTVMAPHLADQNPQESVSGIPHDFYSSRHNSGPFQNYQTGQSSYENQNLEQPHLTYLHQGTVQQPLPGPYDPTIYSNPGHFIAPNPVDYPSCSHATTTAQSQNQPLPPIEQLLPPSQTWEPEIGPEENPHPGSEERIVRQRRSCSFAYSYNYARLPSDSIFDVDEPASLSDVAPYSLRYESIDEVIEQVDEQTEMLEQETSDTISCGQAITNAIMRFIHYVLSKVR